MEDEEIKNLDILRLSYRHLPAHLKPCFLYLGIFPEDDVIRASQLIKLWVAEGFVKSNKTQSLEDVARGYLHDLIDRNLLISRSSKWNGKTKTCEMHDILRNLCLQIGEKESFLCVIRAGDIQQQGVVDKAGRIVFQQGTSLEQTNPDFDGLESAFLVTRSLVRDQYLRIIKFKLLSILEMRCNLYYKNDILKQVNLRYACIEDDSTRHDGNHNGLISSISLLWNLQTIIIDSWQSFIAPPEIWEMRKLRHVKIYRLQLPDPPPLSSNQLPADELVLPNLHCLRNALNLRLSEEVCKRIVNVKKLVLVYDDLSGNLSFDFGRLHKLESLNCFFIEEPNRDDLLQSLTFPSSLQELTLSGYLRWEDLSMIGSLPHLQFLHLDEDSFTGPEWSRVEGEFLCLKILEMYYCNLINWNKLEDLNEIPSGVGEIPTLGSIELSYCSESAAISAMKILEEQVSLGNDGLQVEIDIGDDDELRSFKKKVKHMDCFTSTNLHLTC